MKIICPVHGAHFQDEIDDIVNCKWYWKQAKTTRLPKKVKYIVAEYIMSFPSDEIWLKYKWSISPVIHFAKGKKTDPDNVFAEEVPGYKDWTDTQRRNYQRKTLRRQLSKQRKKEKRDIIPGVRRQKHVKSKERAG